MAKIVDPDNLNDTVEIQISTSGKTVRLSATGNLSNDGVTIKCVYSKLKELWKSNENYIKYAFPMGPITDEQFEMINSWDWYDNTTRYLLRDGGWAVKNDAGVSTSEWAGIITLGTVLASAQVYFTQGAAGAAGSAATNFQLSGAVNQAIQVYTSGGNDYRGFLKLFLRDWGSSYDDANLADIGVTTMSYQAYRFPLTHAADIKITDPMSAMSAAPFSGIKSLFYTNAQQRNIGGTNRDFHVILSANAGTDVAEDIYERVQYLLTINSDINCGWTYGSPIIGKTSDTLLHFVGDTMYTEFFSDTPTGGTFIDNYQSSDINRLVFVDDTDTERQFPYTAVLTLNFGDNLVNDAQAKYWVYFTNDDAGDNLGRDYGTLSAIMIHTDVDSSTTARSRSSNVASISAAAAHNLSAGESIYLSGLGGTGYNSTSIFDTMEILSTPSTTVLTFTSTGSDEGYTADTGGTIINTMSELVSAQSSIQKTFEYDTNHQRGNASSGTDAPITCVALGLSAGQFVKATGTIARSTANTVSLVAALERNYSNPA